MDSSALAKLYLPEAGSQRILELLAASTQVFTSILTEAESISAMNRLRREGNMTHTEYLGLKKELTNQLLAIEIIGVDQNIIARAIDLMEVSPLRASDAVQVASAHIANAELFVTADRHQFIAARASGLKVLDPARNSR